MAGTTRGFSSSATRGFLVPPPPPVCDADPLQGYPQHQVRQYPFIHLGEERQCESKVLPKDTTQCPRLGLEPRPPVPESSALAMRTMCLHT